VTCARSMKTNLLNPARAMTMRRWRERAAALLAALSIVTLVAAEDFVIENHAALPGSTVRVPVIVPDASGIASVALTINFDSEILSLESVTNGGLGSAFLMEHQYEEGRIKIAAVRDEALSSGAGALVILSFRVNAGAMPGLSSTLAIADRRVGSQYGRDVSWSRPVTSANGTVNVASASFDSDGNGLPDWWEEHFFGRPTGAVASADPDGDGLTTVHEFMAGTDPLDPVSGMRIDFLRRDATEIRMGFRTIEGRSYRIEYSEDLEIWNTLGSEITGTGASIEVVDSTRPAVHSRFYRLANVR